MDWDMFYLRVASGNWSGEWRKLWGLVWSVGERCPLCVLSLEDSVKDMSTDCAVLVNDVVEILVY
jgi:hypothetical protein